MKDILSHPYILILFFIITTIFAWLTGEFESKIINKISILTILLVEAILSFLILLLITLCNSNSIKNIKKDLSSLSKSEIIFIILIGFVGTFFGLWSITMTKYHGFNKVEMLGFFITLIVGSIALHVTKKRF